MKNLGKLFILVTLAFAVASCGNENKSGGGNDAVAATPAPVATTNWYSTGANWEANYNSMKDFYNARGMNEGVSTNMVIYHIGSDYGGSSISGGSSSLSDIFKIKIGFCFNLNGEYSGSCSNNGSDLVSNGLYKAVTSATHASINYDQATGSNNYGLTFESKSTDRNGEIFRRMLNLDNRAVRRVVISEARVTLDNGDTINADYVEYFLNGQGQPDVLEGYILSRDIPMIANPVAITNNGNLLSALRYYGDKTIKKISVDNHIIQYDQRTNTSIVTKTNTSTKTF